MACNVKAFRRGQIVDEFVGAQPEPLVRQFIQRLTANMVAGAVTTSPISADPATRLSQARQLLKQGKGCEAQNRLQNFLSTRQAQLLLPLAQFMCDQGRGGGSHAELNLLFQQAARPSNGANTQRHCITCWQLCGRTKITAKAKLKV